MRAIHHVRQPEFLENGENVIKGIELVTKYLGIKNVIIGIEDNKKEAIDKMQQLILGKDGYQVAVLNPNIRRSGKGTDL